MYDIRRPWSGPFGTLAATALIVTGILVAGHLARPCDAAPRFHPGKTPRPSSGTLVNEDPVFAAPMRAGRVAVAKGPVDLRYTFDQGADKPITDVRGAYQLHPQGQNGGTLSLVPQGRGLAVRYPNRCTLAREGECPRAILQGVRDDALNPGTRPLRYGASILMTHADLSDGANVFQKGYSVGGGSQFKLQVDHDRGHPSCVIVGRRHIYRAEPAVDVADGSWHDLACARAGKALTMTVDGIERARVAVPANLFIANPEPLRVGGKGANTGNDQYAGQIDNVFLSIG
jgi:hypothetical protein